MTTLITTPGTKEVLTTRRWGDASASMARGLSEYIETLVAEEEGGRPISFATVLHEYADRKLPRPEGGNPDAAWPPYPRAVVVQSAACALSMDMGSGKFIAALDSNGTRLRQLGEMSVTLLVVVSCIGAPQRRATAALLEAGLAPVDWTSGLRLALDHYHGVHAGYSLMEIAVADDATSAAQGERVLSVQVAAACPRIQVLTAPEGIFQIEADVE